jgi:hydrogenase-4 component B
LGFWGIASGRPVLGAFGVWGALLHVWNHTAMKGLLFLGAGSVLHATGAKDLEKLGGLMSRAPSVGGMLILGCLAISALPPLNGFVSEWLMYRSLLEGAAHSAPGASVACSLALGGLSAVGALAALCFLRVCGIALLGQPRDPELKSAHQVGRSMVVAMGILSAACLLSALAPASLARAFARVVAQLAPESLGHSGAVIGALYPVGHAMLALAGVLLIAAALYRGVARRTTRALGPTWGCGYAAPTTRMQYTARSFGQPLAELLPALLKPVIRILRPSGLFPMRSEFETGTEDPFTKRIFEPAILQAGHRMARLRWIQQGAVHVYLLYILVALAVGLAWASYGNAGG